MTETNPQTLTLTQPDDWHLHLRDDTALSRTVTDSARYFGRAIIMPNLQPPVRLVQDALAYRQRILDARPADSHFEPLMTLYLTDETSPAIIQQASESGLVHGVKLYPAGATTNSAAGVTDLKNVYPALETMQNLGMPLLVHGEVTDAEIDIFDREKYFIDSKLIPLMRDFPALKIVFEHITTADAAGFVKAADERLAATITAHHLLLNRNDLLVGGVRPHHFCLPVLKRNTHQQALIEAATSGNPRFFLGTDSAPHPRKNKESACGCAGIYTAHAALELYATAFEAAGALDQLEAFASFHGADFYGLPRNTRKITLSRKAWDVPESLPFADSTLVPMHAGKSLQWQVSDPA